MGEDHYIMAALFIVIVPLGILLFALFMERVEARLRHVAVRQAEVEEFLEQAKPEEVNALYGHGIGRALELFRGRRGGRRESRSQPAKVGTAPRGTRFARSGE